MIRMFVVFAVFLSLALPLFGDDAVQVVMTCQDGSKSLSAEKPLQLGMDEVDLCGFASLRDTKTVSRKDAKAQRGAFFANVIR